MLILHRDKVKYYVVHCAYTQAHQDFDVNDIRRWHKEGGYDDVGYHGVITRDGIYQPGRSIDKAGAHARGYNTVSIGTCLIGGKSQKSKWLKKTVPECNFTFDQFSALRIDYHEKCEFFGRDLIPVGHGQLVKDGRKCPCFDVREFFKGGAWG